jgi:Protein of unknown function (DUF3572)
MPLPSPLLALGTLLHRFYGPGSQFASEHVTNCLRWQTVHQPFCEPAMRKSGKKHPLIDLDAAEAIALQGLAFLAEDAARLQRFLMVTGLDPGEIRARAGTAELLAAVLEHLAGDESLLLVFAASRGIAPDDVAPAITRLQTGTP